MSPPALLPSIEERPNAAISRRHLLRIAGAATGVALSNSVVGRAVAACFPAVSGTGPYGPLQPPDANGLMLPAGFQSRILAVGSQVVPGGGGHTWHRAADGGATFRARGGWIYVSNSERLAPNGGVGALRFDRDGNVVDAYSILSGTQRNCAGGTTPWQTWLSCEEVGSGRVWECDPTGVRPPVVHPAMGVFNHEAVCVDRVRRYLYLSEDRSDGRFYRFKPRRWRDLSSGVLEVATLAGDGSVTWTRVPDPSASATPTRHQVPASTHFNGGEGLAFYKGRVFLTTKGDNRIWEYDTRRRTMRVLYDVALDPGNQLTGVDNVVVSRGGDVIVAEDPGNLELVLLSADGIASPLVRVTGQSGTEITGPAFDPRRGTRLYFSSQRGNGGAGITYEVSGPFRRRGPRHARC